MCVGAASGSRCLNAYETSIGAWAVVGMGKAMGRRWNTRTIRVVLAGFALFCLVLVVDLALASRIPWKYTSASNYVRTTLAYWLMLYGCWLVLCPLFVAAKYSLRLGTILFGFSSMLWSVEDSLYYYLWGFPVFSPFPTHPGMYPLLFNWYPVWFLILSRSLIGIVPLAYVVMKPGWGRDRLRRPSPRRSLVVVLAGVAIFAAWYLGYSRASFGGKILYETGLSYKIEPAKEDVFRGILLNRTFMKGIPYPGAPPVREIRYVLSGVVLENGERRNYILSVSKQLDFLEIYFDKEVEILGKLIEDEAMGQPYRIKILVGRIRRAKEAE